MKNQIEKEIDSFFWSLQMGHYNTELALKEVYEKAADEERSGDYLAFGEYLLNRPGMIVCNEEMADYLEALSDSAISEAAKHLKAAVDMAAEEGGYDDTAESIAGWNQYLARNGGTY